MTVVEWMETPEGRRFRFWTTTADAYCGPPMDRAEAVLAVADGYARHRSIVRDPLGHVSLSRTEEPITAEDLANAETRIAWVESQVSDGYGSGRVDRWSVEYDEYGEAIVDAGRREIGG